MIKRLAALAISVAVGGWDLIRGKFRQCVNRPTPSTGVVLYYHAIRSHQRQSFATQMDTLLRCARPFQADSPVATMFQGRYVAVTFDDGFRSVVDNAVPELVKRNIPFTMFVPSGSLGTRPSWVRDPAHPSWGEHVLSPEELRSLAALPLATIGSHSITHPNLLTLDSEHVTRELACSREDLQAAAGTSIDLFSFPHGAFSPALVQQARQAGYRRVFTIEPTTVEADSDVFTVGRVSVDPDDWSIEFRLKLAGAYRWRCYLHDVTHRQRKGLSGSR